MSPQRKYPLNCPYRNISEKIVCRKLKISVKSILKVPDGFRSLGSKNCLLMTWNPTPARNEP